MYKKHKQYRLGNYNYSQSGCYFVTICVKNRENHFGKINNAEMILSEIGNVTRKFWIEIPDKFNDVFLDEFVVMPDHFHGLLLFIKENEEPHHIPIGIHPLVKNSLASVINHFKGNVKRWCNKNGFKEFAWQPRFYDHIVRDEKALNKIREYIYYNPVKWEYGKDNLENLKF